MENKVVADKIYDTLIIGPVSRDINIDCEGNEQRELGGAVIASGYAAACMNRQVAVFTKCNKADADPMAAFQGCKADVYVRPSEKTCSIQNVYHTPDKERVPRLVYAMHLPLMKSQIFIRGCIILQDLYMAIFQVQCSGRRQSVER